MFCLIAKTTKGKQHEWNVNAPTNTTPELVIIIENLLALSLDSGFRLTCFS
jgi:hypothetical protein